MLAFSKIPFFLNKQVSRWRRGPLKKNHIFVNNNTIFKIKKTKYSEESIFSRKNISIFKYAFFVKIYTKNQKNVVLYNHLNSIILKSTQNAGIVIKQKMCGISSRIQRYITHLGLEKNQMRKM